MSAHLLIVYFFAVSVTAQSRGGSRDLSYPVSNICNILDLGTSYLSSREIEKKLLTSQLLPWVSDISLWALPGGQQPSIFGHSSLLITSLTEPAEGWWLAGAEWAGLTSENNHIIDNTMVKEQFRYISILEVSGGRDEGGGRWPCWPSWPAAHWPSWHTCWRRWCPRWGWRTGGLFDKGLDKVRGSLLCSPWGTWPFWGFNFVLFHLNFFIFDFTCWTFGSLPCSYLCTPDQCNGNILDNSREIENIGVDEPCQATPLLSPLSCRGRRSCTEREFIEIQVDIRQHCRLNMISTMSITSTFPPSP